MIPIKLGFDKSEVDRFIDALPGTTSRAKRYAVSKATSYAKKGLITRLTAKTGIRSYVFKEVRVKSKRQGETGVVWFGRNTVRASFVGALRQDEGGAWAGPYFFKGGFIAKMKSGYSSIFERGWERTRTGKIKLLEQGVDLDSGVQVFEGMVDDAGIVLKSKFVQKIKELNPHIE